MNPDVDGKQAGLTYRDRYGVRHQTHHLEVMASCGYQDPDHSYEGGRIQLNDGKCNGWLRPGSNDSLSIGYYERDDLSFLGQAATDWTTFDRYFSAVMAETYPNRFYLHCAQTDRLHNGDRPLDHDVHAPVHLGPTEAKGVSGKYYFSDLPFSFLLGKHAPASGPFDRLPDGRAAGTLPKVSFVDPRFDNEEDGTSNDDHPHADIRAGEAS